MKNVRLDTPQALKQHAQAVYQQVRGETMPLNNATQMTDASGAGRAVEGGAKTSELRRGRVTIGRWRHR